MIFDSTRLGSVTIWYNPEVAFVNNIHSYVSYAHRLIVVDNSVASNQELFDKIEHQNKVYIWNGENMGIARALNIGLQLLLAEGYDFALTLDQDSSFRKEEIEKLLASAQNLDWANSGILSPIHVQQKSTPIYNPLAHTPALCVMTSGNILNLQVAQKVGFFKESLFIDHVDNEYCLRLHQHGANVFYANSFLTHELGKFKTVEILGLGFGGFISHPPERLYFFVRNSLYIISKYFFLSPRYMLSEITALIKRFFKVFLEGQTKKRLKLYFKGIRDFRKLR